MTMDLDPENCWCGGAVIRSTIVNENDTVHCEASPLHAPFATGRRDSHSVLYVAGPMSGYPEANYPAFREAENYLADAGYTVLNPVTVHEPEQCHYVDLLREDLIMMFQAHGIAVLDNWWESTGARNEVQVGGLLKMPIRTVDEWLHRAALELKEN